MSRKWACLIVPLLLTALATSVGKAGVPSDVRLAAKREAPISTVTSEPVVLAQIAPGTSEAQAVAESSTDVAEVQGLGARIWGFLTDSYAREPALMIALALVFVLSPLVSIILLATQSANRAIAQRMTTRGESLKQAMQAASSKTATTEPGGATIWTAEAELEFVDAAYDPLPLLGRMLRIGRHEENDVRLADKTVHRHHAVLQLTGEQGYTITDLSGAEGNGVLVNSERVTQAQLRDGDIIELGTVKLRFALGRGRTSGRPAGQTHVTLH